MTSDELSARMKSTLREVFELFDPRKNRRHVELDYIKKCIYMELHVLNKSESSLYVFTTAR